MMFVKSDDLHNFKQCKVQPKRVENGHVHPYCGRTCAVSARVASTTQAQNNNNSQAQAQPALCTVCTVPSFLSRLCLKFRYRYVVSSHAIMMARRRTCSVERHAQQRESNSRPDQDIVDHRLVLSLPRRLQVCVSLLTIGLS